MKAISSKGKEHIIDGDTYVLIYTGKRIFNAGGNVDEAVAIKLSDIAKAIAEINKVGA